MVTLLQQSDLPLSSVPVGGGALSGRAHIFILVATLVTVVWMVRLVRRHKLRTKYSLLWVVLSVALAVVAVFPGLLERLSRAAGIYYPPATFLLMAVGFLFVVVVHFSWEFSRSDDRIRALAEEVALLRAEHEQLVLRLESVDTDAGTVGGSVGSAGDDDESVGGKGPT